MIRYRRYSERDTHIGPYITCYSKPRTLGVVLDSGDDEYPGCSLRITLWFIGIILELPAIIKPYQDEYRSFERQYGFTLAEGGFVSLYYGRQTYDSSTEQRKGYFLPWTQWRVCVQTYFDRNMKPMYEIVGNGNHDKWFEAREKVDRVEFWFEDYDGSFVSAYTYADEMVFRLGTGRFKWLGYIWPKKVRRSLTIEFSEEVGPEKGSYKGGMTGHGIEMLPGEDHAMAFERYWEQELHSKSGPYRIKYIGKVSKASV